MEERNDHVFDRLKHEIPGLTARDVYWHATCYSVYASKHNIQRAPKRKVSISPTPVTPTFLEADQSSSVVSRPSRTKQPLFDSSNACFAKILLEKN